MTTPTQTQKCNDVIDDLSAIVAGEAAAIDRHADHLAECDACRDARHDAAELTKAVARAGGDHAAMDGDALADAVLARIGDAEEARSGTGTGTGTGSEKPKPKPVPVKRSGRSLFLVAAVGAVAAAAGVLVMKRGGDDAAKAPAVQPDVVAKTGGIVTRIERAAAAGEGVFVGGVAVAQGAKLGAGAALKTDAHTRVWVTLADGTTLALDHGTELTLGAQRAVTLTTGRVVADVAHVEGQVAWFTTPRGKIEVLGTQFLLTADAGLTSVRVSRGSVKLHPAAGAAVEVRAGEEGLVTTGAPEVAAAPSLSTDVAWAEILEGVSAADPAAGADAGIGALRAYKPGERRDRDWDLALEDHQVKVRIVGPLARTEITEVFRNDSDHELEGVYQFPLPADAKIDGLELDDQKGGMMQGAFLDRERAAGIWRGVIDRATPKSKPRQPEMIWVPGPWRDPALLEWERGGRFELRIFPIPAHGSRTIKISYTQVVAPHGNARRYVYPLPHSSDGSTVAENFGVELEIKDVTTTPYVHNYEVKQAAVAGKTSLGMAEKAFVPHGDFIVDYRDPQTAELRAWTFAGGTAAGPDEKLVGKKQVGIDPAVVAAQRAVAADARPAVVVALRPQLPRWREQAPRDFTFVVDTSQSMVGERHERAAALTAALVGELDRRDRFTVLACDDECRSSGALRAPGVQAAADARTWLEGVEPAGASDLVASLRAAAALSTAGRTDARDAWIIYVGDGFATTGFRRASDVEEAVAAATAASGVRVTAVGIGADSDQALLEAAARGGGGAFVGWVPGQRLGTAALAVLETTYGTSLRDATLTLPDGVVEVMPAKLPTLRAGEEAVITARFTGTPTGEAVLRGTVGGQPFEQRYPLTLEASTKDGNAFVSRMWAAGAVAALERGGRGEDRARIVALSQAYGVLSRHTSLLVLESDAMFDAFGVDRSTNSAKWTGEEALDEVAADGLVSHDPPSPPGYAPSDKADAEYEPKTATKSPAPAKKMKAPMEKDVSRNRSGRGVAMDDAFDGGGWGGGGGGGGGRGVWMKKVWYRVAAVGTYDGVSDGIVRAVADAEARLAEVPDSRERHRALVQALAYAGDLDRAFGIASRWLERDRLDPQALVYMADVMGRQGKRDDSLRLLGGIVDLAPDDTALHERLAAAHERVGRLGQACGHRIALASIKGKDARVAGAAMRCLRRLGRDADAKLVLRNLPSDKLRVDAEQAATAVADDPRLAGDLTIVARWEGGGDADLSLVTPQGSRVSWMGGRVGVAARDVGSTTGEQLALEKLTKGRYLVELARTKAGDKTPLRGTLEITALGQKRTVPFELIGDHVVVSRIAVTMASRLVEVR